MRREKPYADLEAARRDLLKLHEQFPEVSIPGADRLNIIVYHKRRDRPSPVEKVQLLLKPLEAGRFLIVHADPRPPMPAREESPDAVKGKFTALVEMKRKRKPVHRNKPEGAST